MVPKFKSRALKPVFELDDQSRILVNHREMVRANWRMIFCFEEERAADVNCLNYNQKG